MRLLLVLVLLPLDPLVASADDWPQWRGPGHNGISTEKGWLDRWPAEGPKVAWKAEIGTGFSSVAVADGRLFASGNADNSDTIFCIEAETGRTVWTHSYPSDLGDNLFEGGPTATAAVDDNRVFTLGRWGDFFAFEAGTGRVVWSKNLQKECGFPAPTWGWSGSPLVLGDRIILNVGDAGIALDKASGKIVWKSAAKESGYSTPFPVKQGDSWVVLLSSTKAYLAVDPENGLAKWTIKWATQYGVNAADPIVDGDRVLLSTGYGKGSALLRVGGAEPVVVWESRALRCQMGPGVLLDDHVYGIDGNEKEKVALKCIELATGEEKWSYAATGSGTVTVAAGKLIFLAGNGELLVGPASPGGFVPSARARILEGKCWTVPVLSNGRVFARNAEGRLICLDLRSR